MNMRISGLAAVAALAAVFPAAAHHSDAGVDMSKIVAFDGTIKEFYWKNPHVYFTVNSVRDGKPVVWEVQMANLSGLARNGWTADTLRPGDKVSVRAHPAIDGRTYSIYQSVEMEGGLRLSAKYVAPAAVTPTKTIAGKWLTQRSSVREYPGGFDGFFRANLVLTDKAKAAQASYNPLGDEAPEASCNGRPTPSALVSTGGYVMEIDLKEAEKQVIIRSEWYNEVRTVYMDGRKHPDPSVRLLTGHSIGRWEGKTLVIDTANFADHRSPYQIGVPSGPKKHVIERYTLQPDGLHMDAEFTLEDPDYLAKPMVHKRVLAYSPAVPFYLGECDKLATSRFLPKNAAK